MEDKIRRALYKIVLLIFVLLCLFLLAKLFPYYNGMLLGLWRIMIPFLISGFIAFLLHPIVEKLHEASMPRWAAILVIFSTFFAAAGFAIYKGLPRMIDQLKALNDQLPEFAEAYRGFINGIYQRTSDFPEGFHDQLSEILISMEAWANERITMLLASLSNMVEVMIIAAVIPVLTFYFLKDFDRMKGVCKKLTPKRFQSEGKHLLEDISISLGGYIRGQLLVCLFVGLFSFLGFWIIGIKYPLLLGIVIGATNIIPYFGPLLGAIPAVIIAMTTSWKMVVFVLITIIIVQMLEGNLLSPYIVGKSIHIHPILIILALLVGEEVAGVLGMILAVPVLTCLKVLLEHLWEARALH
ncbi:AI-2E family transporter [Thalassobacillus pellis]|uniref:AI-2E family transporter n=1 Tax=Thalassobacillus pellis TaxID=748008 RepID=UPI00195FBA36|nr:AI-2E family transporter [Thalassobacillus pellis]MBM7554667.1 putative PurR-regulated permease PerM [Thalassobacillus pellis]